MFYIARNMQRFIMLLCIPVLLFSRFISWYRMNETSYIAMGYNYFPVHSFYPEVEQLSFVGKSSFFILESLAIIFLMIALWCFWQVLELYKHGVYFSLEVVNQLKKIIFCLLGWSIYKVAFPTLASLVISCFKAAGERYVIVMVGTEDIVRFFVVLILCMLLHIIQEACKIKSEQDLVV